MMRLNLSRLDVDVLLDCIDLKRRAMKRPKQKQVNRLLKLKDQLLIFRSSVWGDTAKEAMNREME